MPKLVWVQKGGPGSGNHGHSGRPGERGGSGPGGDSTDLKEGLKALSSYPGMAALHAKLSDPRKWDKEGAQKWAEEFRSSRVGDYGLTPTQGKAIADHIETSIQEDKIGPPSDPTQLPAKGIGVTDSGLKAGITPASDRPYIGSQNPEKMAKDAQNVYEAEYYAREAFRTPGTPITSQEEAQGIADRILEKYGGRAGFNPSVSVTVTEPYALDQQIGHQGTAGATARGEVSHSFEIQLDPKYGMNQQVLIHELAHALNMEQGGVGHGQYFRETYSLLLQNEFPDFEKAVAKGWQLTAQKYDGALTKSAPGKYQVANASISTPNGPLVCLSLLDQEVKKTMTTDDLPAVRRKRRRKFVLLPIEKGGAGSGNHGHSGRPGERGGSGGGSTAIATQSREEVIVDAIKTSNQLSDQPLDGKDVIGGFLLPDGDIRSLKPGEVHLKVSQSILSKVDLAPTGLRSLTAVNDAGVPRVVFFGAGKSTDFGVQMSVPLTSSQKEGFRELASRAEEGTVSAEVFAPEDKTGVSIWSKVAPNTPMEVSKLLREADQAAGAPVLKSMKWILKGGPGSGNFGHEGRPGERGGSGAGGSGDHDRSYGNRVGPNKQIRDIAQAYMKSAGLPPIKNFPPQNFSPVEGKAIANYYESAKSNGNDPEVKRSYEAFNKELEAQRVALVKAGMKFEPWDKPGQPYQNSKEVALDVKNNMHLYYFKSDEGTTPNENMTLKENDTFRMVHDVMGHSQGGYSFSRYGETNAYLEHAQMFSPEAQRALSTETIGQNMTLIYGSHPGTFPEQKSIVLPMELYQPLLDRYNSAVSKAVEFDDQEDAYGNCPAHFMSQNADMPTKKPSVRKNRHMEWIDVQKGGKGSGHFGHAGRPGERGGSSTGEASSFDGNANVTPVPHEVARRFADQVAEFLTNQGHHGFSVRRSSGLPELRSSRDNALLEPAQPPQKIAYVHHYQADQLDKMDETLNTNGYHSVIQPADPELGIESHLEVRRFGEQP